MLIGVRLGESAVRDRRIALACSRNGAECGQGWYERDLPDAVCDKLSPLLHWRTCLVWDWLMAGEGPARADAPDRLALVRELRAAGASKDEILGRLRAIPRARPSHGFPTQDVAWAYGLAPDADADELGARTGCVGCALAEKETALDNLLQKSADQWGYLGPLKRLKPIYRQLREPRNRLRQPPGERRKDGTLTSNQNRMGPLTMEARLWALGEILAIQAEVNAGAAAGGRPTIDLLNAEEEGRIRELIAANTWPQKWDGDEPVADLPYVAMYPDGSTQPLLFPTLNGTTA